MRVTVDTKCLDCEKNLDWWGINFSNIITEGTGVRKVYHAPNEIVHTFLVTC